MSKKILLAAMPFLPLERPALGLGLLKAILQQAGIPCETRYFQFAFVDHVGFDNYRSVDAETPTHDLVGDWIFTRALYGDQARPDGDFAGGVFRAANYTVSMVRRIESMRAQARAFVRDCADWIGDRYDIVGFSSTFQQNIASLALAAELKRRRPDIRILFGGANCEGEMGETLLRQFDCIDVVVSGEADETIVELVQRLRQGRSLAGLGGVAAREAGDVVPAVRPARPVNNLGRLPYPDHADFVRDFEASSAREHVVMQLVMETSRGCWWGQKHHCTFCGLNGQGMSYRSKSPERALDEVLHLVDRYGAKAIFNTDNIVDMRYFTELFPRLRERGLRLQLFYETKSNLKKWQLRELQALGTNWFQPGMESLNTHVLTLMNKGVTGIQNVQLLKWAQEMGFDITWNLLCGFPGERPEDYDTTNAWIPLLSHLQPPSAVSRFRLDRFSPMFDNQQKYGISNPRPYPAYRLCYPFAPETVAKLAYFFDCDVPVTEDTLAALRRTWDAVATWKSGHRRGALVARASGSDLVIEDRRVGMAQGEVRLGGRERDVYLAADRVRSRLSLLEAVRTGGGASRWEAGELESFLSSMVARGLMLREDDHYLSLAVLQGVVATEAAVGNGAGRTQTTTVERDPAPLESV